MTFSSNTCQGGAKLISAMPNFEIVLNPDRASSKRCYAQLVLPFKVAEIKEPAGMIHALTLHCPI